MGFVEWHLIATVCLICFVILTWFRIRIILGGTLMRVMPPRKKWGLTLGAISALLSIISLLSLVRRLPQGAPPEWVMEHFRQQIIVTASSAAAAVIGVAASALDGLVRQEGIYRGRIYTWDQMLEYRTEGTVLYIGTTRTNWLGRPKQIKWDLQNRMDVRDLVAILEEKGISRRQ